MIVPFLSLKDCWNELESAMSEALLRVGASGQYILGPEVDAFEEEFAGYVGAKHCVGVGNGLDALMLALRAIGVGPGDEVIVPSNTFVATWLAVTHVGALVRPVEPCPRKWTLDPERVEAAIGPRTKVIMPVHLYGLAADLPALSEIADRRGICILDDAAQAHGAEIDGRRIGSLVRASAWSFYPGKNLGALGDAGAVTTNDDRLAQDIRIRRNYGSRIKYHNELPGVNSRLDELQAAILRVKLRSLDAWNERREEQARRYREGLVGLDIQMPEILMNSSPKWHLFPVLVPDRERLARYLGDRGIQTLVHYPVPPHLQPAYRSLGWTRGALPIAEFIHDHELSLPIGPHLAPVQIEKVIQAVKDFLVMEHRRFS